jgi:hypothetical protein
VGASLFRSGVHDGERAGPRPLDPTRDWRVHVADAGLGQEGVDGSGCLDADGRRVEHVRHTAHGYGGHPACHLPRRGPVGQAQHDDTGRLGNGGDGVHERGALRRPVGACHVVGDQLLARSHEVGCEGATHVAEADEPDAHPEQDIRAAVGASDRLEGVIRPPALRRASYDAGGGAT